MSRKKEANGRKKEPIDYLKIGKIADPIIQTMLIIMAFYVFDKRGTRYHSAMISLIRWQVFSSVINLFLKFTPKYKLERYIALAGLGLWLWAYNYVFMHVTERYFYVILGKGPTRFSVFDTILMLSGLALAFWYFSICLREVQKIVKKRRKVKRG